jgi:H/ACA ribonucleoprotein complex subunit 1
MERVTVKSTVWIRDLVRAVPSKTTLDKISRELIYIFEQLTSHTTARPKCLSVVHQEAEGQAEVLEAVEAEAAVDLAHEEVGADLDRETKDRQIQYWVGSPLIRPCCDQKIKLLIINAEMGSFLHACEGELVCESINTKIPYFNAPIYLQNKTAIGKVDEILGPINQVYFTIKPTEGIQASSFKSGDKFYIGGDKLLPLEKFLPKPKPPPGAPKPKRAGGARGGRGAPMRGGRGGARGAPRGRGGFSAGGRGGGGRGGGFGARGGAGGRGGGRGGSRGGFTRGRG